MELVRAAGGLGHRMVAFRVEGAPLAKARARKGKRGFYAVQKSVAAEEAIAWHSRSARNSRIEGNVALAAIFYRPNRHRIDVDNLLKTVLDGITLSGSIWEDDSHVTALLGVIEFDADWPRTAVAIAPHVSSLLRGEDSFTHTCETCGKRYRPHGGRGISRFCSRACRTTRICLCIDCGGPTSAPHVKRCRKCSVIHRRSGDVQSSPATTERPVE